MILCVGTTPAAQRVMRFGQLQLNAVNRAAMTWDGAAGKSINVAKVLQALGEQPLATGFLGGDRGEFVRSALEARGIGLDFVTVAARTRQCITVLDEATGTITELVEESPVVAPEAFAKLLAIIRARVAGCRAVVMSGTIAPGGPVDLYLECTRMAHAAGAISAVDAQGAPLLAALKGNPGLVKPNRTELARTLERELAGEHAVRRSMRELAERGAERIVVTAGKEGALAFDGRSFWRIQAPPIAAVNPIGSGDAFTAAVVWRLVQGDELGEACRWGAAAGAANALTAEVGELDLQTVRRLVREVKVELTIPE